MSYIVHQKMPLRCFECPFCHTIGYFECVLMNKDLRREHGINISRPDWCPLVEVEPYGRLIDIKSVEDGKFVNADNEY